MLNALIVEDEKEIARVLESGLSGNGFRTDVCHNGAEGLRRVLEGAYDVVVLDIMLPGLDGTGVLRAMRRAGSSVPVILLTARNSLEDRVQGLDLGADDYLTKPFYVEELVARVKALLRRRTHGGSVVLSHGAITLNRSSREVTIGAVTLVLTSREYGLLELLMRTPGNVYTRTEILERVWDLHFDPSTNIIEVYVRKLRLKLAEAGAADVIETIRGVGYRLGPGA